MLEKTACSKCGYLSEENKFKSGLPFCPVCYSFAPHDPEKLDEYVQDKASWQALKPFRKYAHSKSELQKKGMIKKASNGLSMSRPPFGYKYSENELTPAENWQEVEEIFQEFLNNNISLTQLAKKHNLSVNGLKKILRNFTYVGKVKFNGQIHDGNHKPLLSSTLFNHVQNKLEKKGITKNSY